VFLLNSTKEFDMNAIKKFMQEEEGAVAIEYGLLAALIALAIVLGARFLGRNLCGIFNSIGTFLSNTTVPYAFVICA